MARIRSIHPGLHTDEAFMQLTLEAPLAIPLWLGLLMEADDHGVFEVKPLTLKARYLPAVTAGVGELLPHLERLNMVRLFTSGSRQYGAIRNFCKFQRPKKPKYVHPLPNEMRLYVRPAGTGSELNDDETSDGSVPVGNQFVTSGEIAPQIGGGRREEEETSSLRSEVSPPLPPASGGEAGDDLFQAPASVAVVPAAASRRRRARKPAADDETMLAVVDAWNDSVQGAMPKAHGLAKKGRPELIAKALEKSHGGVGALRDLFRACAASPHHRGENERGWTASLDWILNPRTRDEKAELWGVDWEQALLLDPEPIEIPALNGVGGYH